MPIYEEEGRVTREDLFEFCKWNKCKECGAFLNVFMDFDTGKAFLACADYRRTGHEGIERPASRYEKEGLASLNINTRREIMENEHGPEKTKALDKYMGVVSLTKPQAKEILLAVYPLAPEQEIARAVLLCASYGLNPLMKHVFLIKFDRYKKDAQGKREKVGEDWVTVMGIKAKRLLSSRRGSYSYVGDTPRVMTDQEQRATFGEVDGSKLWVITKVKDPQTGAEAVGYGFWPQDSQPQGTEKGNSKFNMAAIRSESQALDRLRPGEMPEGIEVIPEEAAGTVIEGEYKEVPAEPSNTSPLPGTEVPKEHWCEEHNCAFELKKSRYGQFYSHKLPDGGYCKEGKKNNESKEEPAPSQGEVTPPESEPGLDFDPAWLQESLKKVHWVDPTVKSYLKNVYRVDTEGTVIEVVARLTKENREKFFAEIQDRLQMA